MKISFDREDGRRVSDGDEQKPAVPAHEVGTLYGPSFESSSAQKRVESLVVSALLGALPRERELLPHEAQKLRPRHIAIIMRIAAGMTVPEAEIEFNMTRVRIYSILKHPDSIKIMGALQAQAADKLSDVGARLQSYANEMLTTKMEVLRTTKNEGLKDKIASDILDRAGYGPRRQVDVNGNVGISFPAGVAHALVGALKESDKIGEVDYRQFTGKNLSAPVISLESGAGDSSRPVDETENLVHSANSASPVASPENSSIRRIA